MSDAVAVMPGPTGSTVVDHGTPVWPLSQGSVLCALRTFGGSIRAVTLLKRIGSEHSGEGAEVTATRPDQRVIPEVWTRSSGYDRLVARLTAIGYRLCSSDLPDQPDQPRATMVGRTSRRRPADDPVVRELLCRT